jgi:predicted metal-dependent peptidase
MSRAEEVLGIARLIVRRKTPYFRAALLTLVPKPVEGMGTIGVTDRALMLYDPEWVAKFKPDYVAGLLVHEIMHLVQKASARRAGREHDLWNMACDLAINPSVIEMGYELPDGEDVGMFPKQFGWPEGETADEYYRKLSALRQAAQNGKSAAESRGVAAGNCGSCAGHPHDEEGTPEEQTADGGRSPAYLDRMTQQVADAVREHAKGRGKVPSAFARWAEEALEPPKVPWRQQLASLVRNAVAYRPGAVVHRYDGPSRRQAGIGYGPGKPILPRLRQPVPRVAVVADTSGSMGSSDLGIALREASGVLKAVGAEVTFCTCDAEVHGVSQVASVEQMARQLKGGGGTDFTPAFEALARQRPRPELVVFATDGDGRCPKIEPGGMKVLWLLVGKHAVEPCAWGTKIRVED